MKHKELIQKAMPLVSLTNSQWDKINEHLSKLDGELLEAFNIIITNQSRIEIMGNYYDYYADRLEDELPDSNIPIQTI